jgi:hypothetical protein
MGDTWWILIFLGIWVIIPNPPSFIIAQVGKRLKD